jgi:hypothetical protein
MAVHSKNDDVDVGMFLYFVVERFDKIGRNDIVVVHKRNPFGGHEIHAVVADISGTVLALSEFFGLDNANLLIGGGQRRLNTVKHDNGVPIGVCLIFDGFNGALKRFSTDSRNYKSYHVFVLMVRIYLLVVRT